MKIQFKIIDLIADDIYLKDSNKFCITLYGKDEDNNSIACHVLDYLPYFYFKIPDSWDALDSFKFLKRVCQKFPEDEDSGIPVPLTSLARGTAVNRCKTIYGKDFYNFDWDKDNNNFKECKFYKACFNNLSNMKKVITELKKFYNNDPDRKFNYLGKDLEWINLDRTQDEDRICDSNLYESSLHPIIRFIHERDIDPTGWIECEIEDKCEIDIFNSKNISEFACKWNNVYKIEDIKTINYKIASFDIECDSLHGDFPMAKKTFKKHIASIFDSYKIIDSKCDGIKLTKPENDDDSDDDIECGDIYLEDINYDLISLLFGKKVNMKSYYKYVSILPVKTKGNRIIHNDFLKVLSNELTLIENIERFCDSTLKNKDRDKIINDMTNVFMEYCKDENDNLIELEGDPIIQIGTVFHDYGTDEWYRNILVIGPEDNLPNDKICDTMEDLKIDVVHCKTEEELLLKWQDLIKTQDPDFITGYNIFGFDFRYINDRVDEYFPCPKSWNGRCRCNSWGHHETCPKKLFYDLGKIKPDTRQKHNNKKCVFKTQDLNSSALGENKLSYFTMDGRILFDIQKEIEKGHNLDSYKLDNVASYFMRGKLKQIDNDRIKVSTIGHLKNGDYISFSLHSNIGEESYNDGQKIKIKSIHKEHIFLEESLNIDFDKYDKIEWCLNKDDISPQDIFDKHKDNGPNGAKGRAEVAKYCIQDCELCINLLLLLDIIPNNLAMANVSFVPASYIFLRGQGVKVTSVVTKMCSQRKTLIPELIKIPNLNTYVRMAKDEIPIETIKDKIIEDSDWRKPSPWELDRWCKLIMKKDDYTIPGYEGAIVLDPTPGIYLDDPVTVLDYASLYPSSIIEKNISHETLINEDIINELNLIEGVDYHKIDYDNWIYKGKGTGDTIIKELDVNEPKVTCYFLTKNFMEKMGIGSMGIIPSVLSHLLDARKQTKKRMKNEPDDFKKKVLDGLQLAYKVTANSVYGQLGAKTSTIFKMELAACTTSVGRERLTVDAKNGVKMWAKDNGYEEPEVVYGDTDSVFVKFSRRNKQGILLEGKEALEHCIKCGEESGEYIKNLMDSEGKQPQVLEYEKTFWPFILISKKRYTGDKYEFNTVDKKRTAMGIVLKRRDNAPIVKYVFGHVIEKIMIEKDFKATVEWLKETLIKIRKGEFPISYFIISKSLRGYYKNPQSIAHKVLADRMADRDPGNKPKANDRIPYAYIKVDDEKEFIRYKMKEEKKIVGYKKVKKRIQNGFYKNGKPKFKTVVEDGEPKYKKIKVEDKTQPVYKMKTILQGDRIEHIDYIKKNNIEIDYEFYISNQIMNPVKQVLDLEMDSSETQKLFML
tara:strand:+ start:874 stop:4872 length:3999 start_codon:yes stop_codon:yes gene_type:complete